MIRKQNKEKKAKKDKELAEKIGLNKRQFNKNIKERVIDGFNEDEISNKQNIIFKKAL